MRTAPAVSCANVHKNTHTSIQVQRRQSDIPLRNGSTAYIALSPENRALLSPSPADSWLIRARSGRLAFRRLDANR
jgi:hypothetical protein